MLVNSLANCIFMSRDFGKTILVLDFNTKYVYTHYMDIFNYPVCEICDNEMSPGNGCRITVISTGDREYPRIPVGDERDSNTNIDELTFCPDCNAGYGQYHHYSCDSERCPACGERLIGCCCGDVEF